ncbi:uncharacterized protein HMPREF1541_09658 [Cyphellophora europaea CBS 101466]|uniref:Uncharacterized protein n=1 Tax=Cyphellophora europaea (strain CBS 101466) TaxID=1220924 RepID=W2S9R9_CYPE1|nr:uncharacterized protein HMPREF1541_09658 [Cyphellophora europaea CBS 101466]ETN44783.1 hypothetical protein HMPREF1541_09658 [Cyphellophora europaea CBS 101466]
MGVQNPFSSADRQGIRCPMGVAPAAMQKMAHSDGKKQWQEPPVKEAGPLGSVASVQQAWKMLSVTPRSHTAMQSALYKCISSRKEVQVLISYDGPRSPDTRPSYSQSIHHSLAADLPN